MARKPGPDDITYEQARELAVAFFIEKCGVEDAILRNAEWKISFGHSILFRPSFLLVLSKSFQMFFFAQITYNEIVS